MNIYEEYAIELLLSHHLKGAEIGNGYITAYTNECKITNPSKLDKWLLKNDYLRKPTIKEVLISYKVTELKEFLSQNTRLKLAIIHLIHVKNSKLLIFQIIQNLKKLNFHQIHPF